MTEDQFYNAINAALPGRVFFMVAPQSFKAPYIVYSRIGQEAQQTLCGYAGLDLIRYQVDSYAATHADALGAIQRAKANLRSVDPEATFQNEQDLFEPDTRVHRTLIDVSTWQEEQP